MTTTVPEARPHVSGFYGPGAMVSWLLIVCSTVVSWTSNAKHKKDILSMDLLVSLAVPSVAAGHMTMSYVHGNEFEPPLTFCHAFSTIVFLLVLLALRQRYWLRAGAVAAVITACAILARLGTNDWDHDTRMEILFLMICVNLLIHFLGRSELPKWLDYPQVLCTTGGIQWVLMRSGGVLVAMLMYQSTFNSILDLDQAFAVAVGAVTLLFSTLDALKSRAQSGRQRRYNTSLVAA